MSHPSEPPALEVVAVERPAPDPARLWGASIDLPRPGAVAEPYALELAGWALGREQPVVAIELSIDGRVVRRLPLGAARNDVAAVFPGVVGAATSGFQALLDLPDAAPVRLRVEAVLADGDRLGLGAIATRPLEARRGPGGGRCLVLLYHRVAEPAGDPWLLAVRPRHFDEHLTVLGRHGRVLSLDQLQAALAGGDLPDRAVVLTFDDGYADNLSEALPLLERHDLPATLFVATGYVLTGREFWWDELEHLVLDSADPSQEGLSGGAGRPGETIGVSRWRAWEEPPDPRRRRYQELWQDLRRSPERSRRALLDRLWDDAGRCPPRRATHRPLTPDEVSALAGHELIGFGGHTAWHSMLAGLPAEEQRVEIARGKAELEALIGRPVTSFAYPFGSRADYTAATEALVRAAGFRLAFTTGPGLLSGAVSRYALPRLQVHDCDGAEFARNLSSYFHG